MTNVLRLNGKPTSHKGLSDMIAILLLLSFTIAVAFLLGTWITELSRSANEKNEENLKDVDCSYADFSVEEGSLRYSNGTNAHVSFRIFNKGSVELYDFAVFSLGAAHASQLSVDNPLVANESLKPGQIASFNASGEINATKFKIFPRMCSNTYVEIEP